MTSYVENESGITFDFDIFFKSEKYLLKKIASYLIIFFLIFHIIL